MGKIKVETCEIEGLKVITPTVFGDSRGYFMVATPVADPRSAIKEDISRYLNKDASRGKWYSKLEMNPHLLEYGGKEATIEDFAIIDEKGEINSSIVKGTRFIIRMKVRFNMDMEDPLYCFTIKDAQGTEITGTNTMFEGIDTGKIKKNDVHTVDFSQVMNLQGRSYLLSFGVVGFAHSKFSVYQRLYDVCDINVISEKNTTGFYDMDSKVFIDDKEQKP